MAESVNKTQKTDLLKIDPRIIKFDAENNPRSDYGDMESLKNFIKENGTESLPPIKVKRVRDEFKLIHGYRRMTAINELMAEGEDIARVLAVGTPRGYNEEDELLDHLFQNSGKPMLPHEEAIVYKKLMDKGYKQREIAKKIGKTNAHISNMIKVASCSKKVQNALADGSISTTLVLKIVQQYGDDADALIVKAVDNTKAIGKGRVTEKGLEGVIKGTPAPRQSRYAKVISTAIAQVTEQKNLEQLKLLRKAQSIVEVMDTYKKPDDLIEKLIEVM